MREGMREIEWQTIDERKKVSQKEAKKEKAMQKEMQAIERVRKEAKTDDEKEIIRQRDRNRKICEDRRR